MGGSLEKDDVTNLPRLSQTNYIVEMGSFSSGEVQQRMGAR